MHTRQTFEVTRERLIVAHVTLLQQYRLFSQRNKENLDRIQRLQNNLIKKNENELQIVRLREAHTAQNEFKTSLQEKASQGKRYKCDVKRMDKAIRMLESMVDKHENVKSGGITIETVCSPSKLKKSNLNLL